ncbi:MAG: histidine phosphatase family protein [Epsilonproteobacteria bacterium]|nr:MAG: histidine phosphatase family protein [Campylobacterota bacterium]RLA67929.1 MAG: histidine phosphatase family protein [Campylobacterota bacterium]
MKKYFYIFRHGETDYNQKGICQGSLDIPLNENGLGQARELLNKLKDKKIEIIYSSDLKRARKTAEILSENMKIPIVLDERLREFNLGEAEGLTKLEAIEKFGIETWDNFRSYNIAGNPVGFPGGETQVDVLKRTLSFLEDLTNQSTVRHMAISTHGGILRNIIHHFLPPKSEPIPIPNCVLYLLRFTAPGTWDVEGPID